MNSSLSADFLSFMLQLNVHNYHQVMHVVVERGETQDIVTLIFHFVTSSDRRSLFAASSTSAENTKNCLIEMEC